MHTTSMPQCEQERKVLFEMNGDTETCRQSHIQTSDITNASIYQLHICRSDVSVKNSEDALTLRGSGGDDGQAKPTEGYTNLNPQQAACLLHRPLSLRHAFGGASLPGGAGGHLVVLTSQVKALGPLLHLLRTSLGK